MEGRHVHPSTLYPGGVGHDGDHPAVHRLLHAAHALRGVHEAGRADARRPVRLLLPGAARATRRSAGGGSCSAAGERSRTPTVCNFKYRDMTEWGRAMGVTPGVVVDGKLVTNDLVDINLGIRILLGTRSTTTGKARRCSSPGTRSATRSTGATRGTSTPTPSRRSATSTASTAGSCRPAGSTARTTWPSTPAAARWPGCGRPRCPAWSNTDYIKATGDSVEINLPKTALKPEVDFEWKIPQWSNTIERDRARTYFQAYAAAAALRLHREGAGGGAGRQDQDVGAVRGARRRRSAAGSPRRCGACCRTTW